MLVNTALQLELFKAQPALLVLFGGAHRGVCRVMGQLCLEMARSFSFQELTSRVDRLYRLCRMWQDWSAIKRGVRHEGD